MPGEQLLLINPRRRRRAKSTRRRHHRAAARRHHPRRRHARRAVAVRHRRHYARRRHSNPRRRHYRRNPMGNMGNVLVPVGIGAAGAVALDILWGYLSPMFGTTFTGNAMMNLAAKSALAVAGSMAAGKVIGKARGKYIMAGALTVYGYELIESLVKQMAPTLPFAGMGAYMPRMGSVAYNPAPYLSGPVPLSGMGAYMQHGAMSGIGGGSTGEMGMF